MKVKNYRDLVAWQKAMDSIEDVYKASKSFPREELYSLTNQVRRAAVSIASNIAEGQGRQTTADFLRHLSIAYGSLREVETQILIASRLGYSNQTTCDRGLQQAGDVGRLLNGLTKSPAR